MEEHTRPREKKVEYVELIYDLIFVYLIGRNNSLLHNFLDGFVDPMYFLAYLMTTLAAIQIWSYTTYYINLHGRNSLREHVFLFVNMFLLYFMGEGTRSDWQGYQTEYHIAWSLILVNIALQYLLELRRREAEGLNRGQTLCMGAILLGEAVVVAAEVQVWRIWSSTWLSLAAIWLSMGAVALFGRRHSRSFVDFPHLSERAMLYVVFSFGEMIITLASYFEGSFSWRGTYFALMAFLIAVGLFLSYGEFFNRIIDREKQTTGLSYLFLHVFIIFAMNNITNGLAFMRDEEIRLTPKVVFLTVSFVLFFVFLFTLGNRHGKAGLPYYRRFWLVTGGLSAGFTALMLLLRHDMFLNIALTAAYVFTMYAIIRRYGTEATEGRTGSSQGRIGRNRE